MRNKLPDARRSGGRGVAMHRFPDGGYFILLRDARLFVRRPELRAVLEDLKTSIPVAPHQIVKLQPEMDHVLRLGRLRFSEFLPDDREVVRGILQAGSCFLTRVAGTVTTGESVDAGSTLLMAFGEAEIWSLPPGTLEKNHVF